MLLALINSAINDVWFVILLTSSNSKFKRIDFNEKTFSSIHSDVKMEKTQQLANAIEGFDSTKLRHTETHEKNPLPDKDGELANDSWADSCS